MLLNEWHILHQCACTQLALKCDNLRAFCKLFGHLGGRAWHVSHLLNAKGIDKACGLVYYKQLCAVVSRMLKPSPDFFGDR